MRAYTLTFTLLASLTVLPVYLQVSESGPISLDRYIETGQTIVIAKCLSVGPLKAGLTADVEMRILHTLKGAEADREFTADTGFYMQEGESYLLQLRSVVHSGEKSFHIGRSKISVVPMHAIENFAELKALPLRQQVIRIFSQRKSAVADEIRRLSFLDRRTEEVEEQILRLTREREVLEKVLEGR